MLRIKRTFVTAMLLLGFAATGFAATLEEVEKELIAAVRKTKSMKAKMKNNVDMNVQGIEIKSVSDFILELMRDGDLYKTRTEGTTMSDMVSMGQKTEQKLLSVCDGKFTYTESEAMGQKTVTKSKPTNAEEMPWSHYGDKVEAKVLPDEKVDGADCYVVEMKTGGQTPGIDKIVFYCRKDCGAQVKVLGYSPDGKVMMTTTVTDIELNKSIPAERFVYKVPDGVTVNDATNMGKTSP